MMEQSLQTIKGVGEKRAQQLDRLGIHNVDELLAYFPRDYRDFSKARPVAELTPGMDCAVHVRILTEPKFFRTNGMTILSVSAADETGKLQLKWFNQPYRRGQIHAGTLVYACGRVQSGKGISLLNPQISEALPGILPVYSVVKGVTQRTVREATFAALKSAWDDITETLPPEMIRKFNLCTRQLALRQIHFPTSQELMRTARRRLTFERMLIYLLSVEYEKARRKQSVGIAFSTDGVREKFLKKLPFQLTNAQHRVLGELENDMSSTAPMNRLLQGDVGSGKTAVALFALCVASANGYQGVLLAPTEILAAQHYEQVRAIFGNSAALLTGSMTKAVRDAVLTRISDGTALCVVGTHALFQQGVRFYHLGLVVTDEQHRFGVQQRAQMQEKGVRPDVLVMSATPIPRTLALLMWGDLDVSVLDELPPGRKPVKTSIIPQQRRQDMYDYIAKQAAVGEQTYVVCPCIEESEEIDAPSVEAVSAEIKGLYPQTRVASLHGRIREPQKQAVISSFRAGEIDVLVATTVIEVGVHVENACHMVVEGADRFGLSQLHQLRGRVGRSGKQAYCFLLTASDSETALNRMKILTESTDGFVIAQRDLELRGPGDFFGTRQHGDAETQLLANDTDFELLLAVKQAAADVMAIPNEQNNALIKYALEQSEAYYKQIAMN